MLLAPPLLALATLAAPSQDETFLEIHLAGCEAVLVDPKDARLLTALTFIAPRVEELDDELDFPLPGFFAPMARWLTGPLHLRVALLEGRRLPFTAQLLLPQADAPAAEAATRDFDRMVRELGARVVEENDGWYRIADEPTGWYGARGSDFLLAVGERHDVPRTLQGHGLPAGVEPKLGFALDLDQFWTQLARGQEVPSWLGALFGEGRAVWAAGNDGERTYTATVLRGCARRAREYGTLAEEPLTPASLRLVPADARWASVGKMNFGGLAKLAAEAIGEATGQNPAPIAHALAAVEPFVGDTWGIYASETTGGGGLLSTVLFVEVSSEAQLQALRAGLPNMVNGMLAAKTKGYVQLRHSQVDGLALTELTFPGLPVPLQPTFAIHDGHLFLGATPQAVLAAVAQARDGQDGLFDNPRMREQFPRGVQNLQSVTFVDTPMLLSDGYGVAGLVCAAITNATRSRTDAARDASPMLPSYHRLASGAKAMVFITRVQGDDIIAEGRMDSSMLVNLTGVCGVLATNQGVMMTSIIASIAIPNLLSARIAANQSGAVARIHSLEVALRAYAADHGRYPERLEVLVTPDEQGRTYLWSEQALQDPWGNSMRYDPPHKGRQYRIYSFGADGRPGGVGHAADIASDEIGVFGNPMGR